MFKFDYVALELVGSQSLVFLWHLLFLEVVALYVVLAHLVDVHILYDFNDAGEKADLYRELFHLKKTVFNAKHDIRIKGYEVEMFIQDLNEKETSAGSYSVLHNKGLRAPEKENFRIDKKIIKEKANQWMRIIDGVLEKPKPAKNYIPEWYKKAKPHNNLENKAIPSLDGTPVSTVKKCMPVFDMMTAGYIMETPYDIYVRRTKGEPPYFQWGNNDAIVFQAMEQFQNHPFLWILL